MAIEITVVYGDPADFKDRTFLIEDGTDRGYFLKWFWKAVYSEQKFGVFPKVLKEIEE